MSSDGEQTHAAGAAGVVAVPAAGGKQQRGRKPKAAENAVLASVNTVLRFIRESRADLAQDPTMQDAVASGNTQRIIGLVASAVMERFTRQARLDALLAVVRKRGASQAQRLQALREYVDEVGGGGGDDDDADERDEAGVPE